MTPGCHNAIQDRYIVKKENIILPLLPIELSLMNQFTKELMPLRKKLHFLNKINVEEEERKT